MDQNLDYYLFRRGYRVMPLNQSNFDNDGFSAVDVFISNQINPQEQWITYNKTTKDIKNVSKEEYRNATNKFNNEKNLQVLKKESFTLIECLLYLIARFVIWKLDKKFYAKDGFNGRHETESLFESFTLIECLLYLIARFVIWKLDKKFYAKDDFNGRHEVVNEFYKQMHDAKCNIQDNRNNWFKGKLLSTVSKIANNFIVDLVAEENKKKNVEKK